MRIKIVVMNPVLHDARVLKEADTLALAGHDVTIVGTAKGAAATHHARASGAYIQLCRSTINDALQTSRRHAFLLAALFGVLIVLMISKAAGIQQALESPAGRWSIFAALLIATLSLALLLFSQGLRSLVGSVLQASLRTATSIALPWYTRLRVNGMVKTAMQGEVDVIHCHDLWALFVGIKIKEKTGAALVWDAHEIYEEVAQGNAIRAHQTRKIIKKHEKSIDHFITINESIASFYRQNYPQLPEAIIIKNATVLSGKTVYDGRLHKAAGLPASQKIALYQGGFEEKRGLPLLIETACYLSSEWTLVMMGWGTLEAELKSMARALQSRTKVRTTPAVVFLPPAKHAELVQWTAGATVGLIPYEKVGLNHLYCTPNKLWEYPAAGVPILCSPLIELIRAIQENGIGWVLPVDASPANYASMINRLEESELAEAVAACKRYIISDNWGLYAARLTQLYETIEHERQTHFTDVQTVS